MKKSLLLLFAAIALPMMLSAITLADNQKLLGHYTTDDIASTGWGISFLKGDNSIAIELTSEELAFFQGSKIVAFRVGLAESTSVSRVFVIPVSPEGVDGEGELGEVTEWSCDVSSQGWNLIELETPYEVNLPAGYRLLVGFDYVQETKDSKPIAAVDEGTIYKSYLFRNGKWKNYGLELVGNLCLQCIAENDNFPKYAILMSNLFCKSRVKSGDDLSFMFRACNSGTHAVPAGGLTYQIEIDGVLCGTGTNSEPLSEYYSSVNGSVSTAGLAVGNHTLTVTAVSADGEDLEEPLSLTSSFTTFDGVGFTRQMHLVEQFTSTGCTYCPQGTANILELTQMRNDIAWVAIHGDMGMADPFRTGQADSINAYQGINGYPEGTFDRTVGISGSSSLYAVLTNFSATRMSTFFNNVEANAPAWATVNINSTYDATTRQAVITVDGDLEQGYEREMGDNSKLTVYITEDGLVAPQVSGGSNYVHNNVMRVALGSVKGVALNKDGDTYKNEFTVDIPEDWNADKLNIVAFISRPLRSGAVADLFVTNANKRKLGESDAPAVMKGDINGDSKIDVADVVALIDVVLSDNAAGIEEAIADYNEDGAIDVADVVALIDLVLSA